MNGSNAQFRELDMGLVFQNQACQQYYVLERYAFPCQIWFRGIEL
jgi:hypothetical protein